MDPYSRAMASGPATRAEHVKTHNSNPLAEVPRAIFIGKAGTLKMRGVDDAEDRTWKVPAGAVIPFRAQYIRTTGTTADDIMALY
ncbi:MAG: hypothetical protein H0W65_09480 [Sphingomonas sp.]|uniref:spike base protein, RCAP_Rcc01079 family n=1 Tax=Sphingomonas sp. TaxID=28214 RepID=UPI0017FF6599|nr:hypothetical protein [Sphingomonas sp.]MBA3667939.1 hypothetical protein [Sphingomonas sp.]